MHSVTCKYISRTTNNENYNINVIFNITLIVGLSSSKDLHQWRILRSSQLKKSSILGRRSLTTDGADSEVNKRR